MIDGYRLSKIPMKEKKTEILLSLNGTLVTHEISL